MTRFWWGCLECQMFYVYAEGKIDANNHGWPLFCPKGYKQSRNMGCVTKNYPVWMNEQLEAICFLQDSCFERLQEKQPYPDKVSFSDYEQTKRFIEFLFSKPKGFFG